MPRTPRTQRGCSKKKQAGRGCKRAINPTSRSRRPPSRSRTRSRSRSRQRRSRSRSRRTSIIDVLTPPRSRRPSTTPARKTRSIPVECPICFEPMQNPTHCEECRQYWCGRCDQRLIECPYCRAPIAERQIRAQQAAEQPSQPIFSNVNGRNYVTLRGRRYPVENGSESGLNGFVFVSDDEAYIIQNQNGRRVLSPIRVYNDYD